MSPQAPPTCDICQMIILGHVFAGYLCLTCKKVYHENCFIEGEPDQELIAKMSKFFIIEYFLFGGFKFNGFIIILLKAIHEELIVHRKD